MDGPGQGLRQVGPQARQRRHIAARHVLHRLHVALGQEEAPPGQHLPEHDAEAEDVARAAGVGLLDQLGREVGELALHHLRSGDPRSIHGPREPEVGDLHDPVQAEEDVPGRDVAVIGRCRLAEGIGPLVRRVQPAERLDADGRRQMPGRVPAGADGGARPAAQIDALHPLHDQVVLPVLVLAEVVDGHDVRVVQVGADPRFLHEHLHERRIVGQGRLDPLDRHGPVEACRALRDAAPHGRHATVAGPLDKLVAPGQYPPRGIPHDRARIAGRALSERGEKGWRCRVGCRVSHRALVAGPLRTRFCIFGRRSPARGEPSHDRTSE